MKDDTCGRCGASMSWLDQKRKKYKIVEDTTFDGQPMSDLTVTISYSDYHGSKNICIRCKRDILKKVEREFDEDEKRLAEAIATYEEEDRVKAIEKANAIEKAKELLRTHSIRPEELYLCKRGKE